MNTAKSHFYKVYIDKIYFLSPGSYNGFDAAYESWIVKSTSRGEAAKKVWDKNGKRLLGLMRPRETKLGRKISLFVSGKGAINARSKNRCLAMRMAPITVYQED